MAESITTMVPQAHSTSVPVAERPAYRLLQDSAQAHPERVALVAHDRTLTYGQLNAEANAVGRALASVGAAPETMVAVMADRDSWAYVMREGALKAGAAFMPVDPTYPEERIRYILEDSGARTVLATRAVIERRADLFEDLSDLDLTVVDAREAVFANDVADLNVDVAPDNLAYVIYTSGSTGRPKGVMIENHSLVNFVDDNEYNTEVGIFVNSGSVSMAIAALTFDVSVFEEFAPLANGMTVVLATEDDIMDPKAMADLILDNKVDAFACTPSYLANMIEIPVFAKAMERISGVDVGAEAFPADLFGKLRAINPSMRIMNSYGPTECTVSATAVVLDGDDDITIGAPIANYGVVCVDEDNNPLPRGQKGELVVLGTGVGRGYIGREDLNKKSFITLGGVPAYKTGDLAVLRADGNVAFHGRIDDQVKLRGLRVELGEVQRIIEDFEGVTNAVITVVKDAQEYLAAYYVADRDVDEDELRRHARRYLTSYMVPQSFVRLEELPLTANGKVDKSALPAPEPDDVDLEPASGSTEETILELARQILQTDRVGATTDLMEAGLSSLGAIRLCSGMRDAFDVAIKTSELASGPTVRELAKRVDSSAAGVSYDLRDDYPLSQTQQGIYFECVRHPGSTSYNLPMLYKLGEGVDLEELARAVTTMAKAHPYLNMRVITDEQGHLRARRRDDLTLPCPVVTCDELPSTDELVRPFDLDSDELLCRAAVYQTKSGSYLYLDAHHIVSDGASIDLMIRDIQTVLDGTELERERYTGYEFALDEEAARASERLAAARDFYDGIFRGCGGDTLPTKSGDADAGHIAFERTWGSADGAAVRAFCDEHDLTHNAFFTAAFAYALRALTNAERPVFSAIYNGRSDPRLQDSVSMLVKTLPVTLDCEPDDYVVSQIEKCSSYLLSAMTNDLYSFAEISRAYDIKADVLFAFQGEYVHSVTLGGQDATEVMLDLSRARAALGMDVMLDGDGVVYEMEYDPSVFGAQTIATLRDLMDQVISEFVVRERLRDVCLLSPGAAERLTSLHDTAVEVPERPAYRLLQDQAAATPDAKALVACDRSLTFAELNAQANAVGHALAALGAGPETRVAVLAERDSWAYVMREGVLKSGGAFMPVDPDYPEERVRYILEDSDCRTILTTAAVLERRSDLFEQLSDMELSIVETCAAVDTNATDNLDVAVGPHDLAYVIYTSGSTGRPKGVMIENHNLVNLAFDADCNLEGRVFTRYGQVTLAMAAFTFDVSVLEEFVPLANGKTVVLATQDDIMDAKGMADLISTNGVCGFTCTPSYLSNMVEVPDFAQAMKGVHAVDVGSEAFPSDLFDKLRAINPTLDIMNSYGPTECTVTATAIFLDGSDDVTIGYPLINTGVAAVDREGRPLPVGALGELAIMGDGVGRGYIGREDLNVKNFIQLMGRPAYRSGDLAIVRADGQIEFHGRMDNLVKLRGLRVELGEIESVLNDYPGVRTSVVLVAHGQTDYLAAYFTADKPVALSDLKAHLSEYLTAYMVPQAIMQLDEMPLTANGKADKSKLPAIEVMAEELVAPQNEMQAKILELAAEVIGTQQLGVTTDLLNAGLSSIGCIRLCALVAEGLGKTLKVSDVFALRTVKAIEEHIGVQPEQTTFELRQEYPLSQTQQGIFFETLMHPDTTIYNIPELYHLDDAVDLVRLRDALAQTLAAHPYLFATIRRDADGNPVAVRNEPEVIDIAIHDELPAADEIVRPFDLEGERLFRTALYDTPQGKYLFLDTHHIVSDGESIDVLLSDMSDVYAGGDVEAETYTGFEFALEEERERATARLDKARAFYEERFAGSEGDTVPVADGTGTEEGNAYVHLRDDELSGRVRAYLDETGVTANAFYVTAFGLALRSFCFAEGATFATIYNGRSDSRIARSVSMFVKTLPVCVAPDARSTVTDAVQDCQSYLLDAMANDIYSFAEVSRAFGIHGDIIFAYQGEVSDAADTHICDLPSSPCEIELSQAKSGMDIDVFMDGNALVVDCSHNPATFSEHTVRALLQTFVNVCRELTSCETIGQVGLTSKEDEAAIRVLHDTDWDVVDRPAYRLVQDQAATRPDRLAVVACDRSLSYAQLNAEANAIGHVLADHGAGPNTMVAVLADRDSWAYVMRQAALKCGGAFLPIDPDYPEERVRYILEDSGARLVLTTSDILERRADLFEALVDLELTVVEATAAAREGERDNLDRVVLPESLAYVIYTSGSTGRPKGVMLTNRNLVNFVDDNDANREVCGYTRRALVSLAVAALTFDFAIMEEFVPLANGMTVVLATKEQIMDPAALGALMVDNRVDVMSCTPSYLSSMLDIPAFSRAVAGLRSIDFGAEAFPPGLYERLMAINPKLYVMNGYGPTEATISCTMQVLDGSGDITIGIPNANVHVATVDREGRLQPLGATGELVIMGEGVGRGYVGRDDLTARSFITLLDMPAYRSGDLTRIRPDGQIEYHGRIDDQVKLRGLRIELGEIESVLDTYPSVRMSVVVVAHGETDYLAAYFTADEPVDLNDLRAHLSEYLTAYMVPQAMMQLPEMPLTANGKIDKRALPQLEETAQEVVAPETAAERKVLSLVSEVIGSSAQLGITTDLFAAGLSSIGCIRLCAHLSDAFDTTVKVADVYGCRTVRDLVEFVGDAPEGVQTYELREEYPLSQTQQGIFVECLRMPGSTAYNIPMMYRLDESIDLDRLAEALSVTLQAHPYLFMGIRTSETGEVVAVRREPVRVEVPILDGLPDDLTSLVRPFDLTGDDYLFRVELFRGADGPYLLMDTHHIVSDGESIEVLLTDVSRAYAGETVESESYTGFEFALDEKSGRESDRLERAKAFYDGIFLGCGGDTLPVRDGREGAGDIQTLTLRSPHAAQVRAFCEREGLSTNAFFTTAFGHALRSFTAAEEPAVFATIYNGRSDARLRDAVCMLVKTLPVLSDAEPTDTVRAAIEKCQTYLLDAMANDLYSFAEISRAYGIAGDILFAYQGDAPSAAEQICGCDATEIDLALSEAKAGMDIDVSLEGEDVVFDCSFSPTQFSEYTVRALLRATSTVSRELTQRATFAEVRLVDPEDEAAIRALHDSAWDVADRPAYRLVQDQAAAHVDATALVACDRSLTYAQLNAEANAIGHVLAGHGAGPESMVAVLADRNSWAYVMRQAALKCGGAFLPIDPEYPEERVRYILEDSGARLVLTTAEILERRADLFEALIDLELTVVEATAAEQEGGRENLDVAVTPDNLAYVIYTSGSTGRPKGVMLTNRNLVNFVDDNDANHEICGYTRKAHVSLAVAALTFDFAIMEEFVPLANGMTVVLATKEQILDPLALAKLMLDNHVDVMSCTPSYLSNMLDIEAFVPAVAGLASIDFGAEAFPPGLYDRLMDVNPDLYVMNGYGPTEATISCTMQVVDGSGDITIGFPNVNVHVATVDRNGRLQPLGATGELAILGDGVGRGYVGRDDLTARSFITLLGMPAYRSGDLARIREDAQIEYRGRMDDQVKLRGLRIELGEIESVLNTYPSVRTSVVVVAHGETDYLAAYFTADEEVDLEALKAHLSEYLTSYMVPQAIMQLEEMPLTANGKVDKKALPTVEQTQAHREVKEPTTDLQRELLEMYKKALGISEIGVDDSFFEVGGTSLTAAKVMMAAMVKDLPITYQDIFDARTVEGLEQVVLSKRADDARQEITPEPESEVASEAPSSYVEMALAHNLPEFVDEVKPGRIGNALLTGSTGFLGSHVLSELLEDEDRVVYCLVRGKTDISAIDRLRASMFYYFERDISPLLGSRIIVVDGDITDMEGLADVFDLDFQTVFNCAASVKHFADFEFLERINVGGVRNLAQLCLEKKVRLVHVSTVSVCGDVVGDAKMQTLTEAKLELGQDTASNAYVHTKFLAEKAILELVGQKGLDAKIMRVGNLMSRQVDGEFQVNFGTNNFMSSLRSYVAMGCCPMSEMDEREEFSPIDETARAIVTLAGTDRRFTVFHPYNSHEVEMGNIILAMCECGLEIEPVDDETFEARLHEALANDAINAFVSPLVNYSLGDDDMRYENPADNSFTVKALYRLGFQWSITEMHYLRQAIGMLITLGFFDVS